MSGRLVAALASDALDRHFLGDGEMVGFRVRPVDQPDGLVVLAGGGGHLHAVAKQFVDRLVHVIQAAGLIASGALEFGQGARDQGIVGRRRRSR